MIKVGIVGLGVIGRHVAEAITRGIPGVALADDPQADDADLDHDSLLSREDSNARGSAASVSVPEGRAHAC